MIQAIILLVFLIFLNSVFAGAEIAVLSMNEPKMKEMAEEGDHRAQILMKITEQPAHFMTAIRVTPDFSFSAARLSFLAPFIIYHSTCRHPANRSYFQSEPYGTIYRSP